MLVLTVEMQEVKVKEIVRFGDLANNDVVAVVNVLGGADLDHLDVTERAIGRALSYREAAVAKVHQHLAPPLQVVPGKRLCKITLGCVRQHQQGEVVLILQHFQVFHQRQRILRPLVLMAEVSDVVDDQDLGTGFDNHTFYRVAEGKLERSILRKDSIRVDLHPEKVVAENIRFSIIVGVPTWNCLSFNSKSQ